MKTVVFIFLMCLCVNASDEARKENNTCIDCNTSPRSASPVDSITAEEIRQEILNLEKQKILRQIRRLQDNITVNRNGSVLRKPRSIAMPSLTVEVDSAINNASVFEELLSDERLENMIVLGQLTKRGSTTTVQCYDERHASVATCVDFTSKVAINWDRVKFAVLRFLVEPEFLLVHSGEKTVHTFAVTPVSPNLNRSKFLSSNVSADINDVNRYIAVDITHMLLRHLMPSLDNGPESEPHHRLVTLRITCLTCGNRARSLISVHPSRKPFLEFGLMTRRGRRASPRCELSKDYVVKDIMRGGCCMVPVVINFKELQLEWILFPPRYFTAYCSGRCIHYTTRSYSAVVQAVINRRLESMGSSERMAMCCFPTATDHVQIVYQTQDGEVSTTQLNEMVVSSCGC